MAEHRYDLGQTVSLVRPLPDRTSMTGFEVVRQLPASVDGEFHYRIRGVDRVERAVSESQLTAAPPGVAS